MSSTLLATLALLGVLLGPSPTSDARSAKSTLGAFVGEWAMELEVDSATFGDRGGAGTGTMTCTWGPDRIWVDCELDSEYDGLGRYFLKTVLFADGSPGSYGAFVTNSWGGGRMYRGEWVSDTELVFTDAWVDPARKWTHQRTTYTFHPNGELSFRIDVSKDGNQYLPHSGGVYRAVSK